MSLDANRRRLRRVVMLDPNVPELRYEDAERVTQRSGSVVIQPGSSYSFELECTPSQVSAGSAEERPPSPPLSARLRCVRKK